MLLLLLSLQFPKLIARMALLMGQRRLMLRAVMLLLLLLLLLAVLLRNRTVRMFGTAGYGACSAAVIGRTVHRSVVHRVCETPEVQHLEPLQQVRGVSLTFDYFARYVGALLSTGYCRLPIETGVTTRSLTVHELSVCHSLIIPYSDPRPRSSTKERSLSSVRVRATTIDNRGSPVRRNGGTRIPARRIN